MTITTRQTPSPSGAAWLERRYRWSTPRSSLSSQRVRADGAAPPVRSSTRRLAIQARLRPRRCPASLVRCSPCASNCAASDLWVLRSRIRRRQAPASRRAWPGWYLPSGHLALRAAATERARGAVSISASGRSDPHHALRDAVARDGSASRPLPCVVRRYRVMHRRGPADHATPAGWSGSIGPEQRRRWIRPGLLSVQPGQRRLGAFSRWIPARDRAQHHFR